MNISTTEGGRVSAIAGAVSRWFRPTSRVGTRKDGSPDTRPLGRYSYKRHQGGRERARRMTQILHLKHGPPYVTYEVYLQVRERYEAALSRAIKRETR